MFGKLDILWRHSYTEKQERNEDGKEKEGRKE
jgi:hypothetical protein